LGSVATVTEDKKMENASFKLCRGHIVRDCTLILAFKQKKKFCSNFSIYYEKYS
jgi:hypothetical protein